MKSAVNASTAARTVKAVYGACGIVACTTIFSEKGEGNV